MNALATLTVTADCGSESGSRLKDYGNDGGNLTVAEVFAVAVCEINLPVAGRV